MRVVLGFLRPSEIRVRQMQRAMRQAKVTVLCLVLRGTIGAGKFGTPEQDFNELRDHLIIGRRHGEPHRVLNEVDSGKKDEPLKIQDEDVDKEPQIERDPSNPFRFEPKISDWDEQRSEWLKKNSNILELNI